MNIQKNRWSSLIDKKPEDMYDPDVNIEAGTLLLSRLRDRIKNPTPAKIGTHQSGKPIVDITWKSLYFPPVSEKF